jgi:hypothetical protein
VADCIIMQRMVSSSTVHFFVSKNRKAIPCLKRLVAGFTPRRADSTPESVHVGFVVGKVALGHAFLRVLRFSPVNILPPWLFILIYTTTTTSRLGGIVASVLATGPKSRGFEPGQGDGFLKAIKIRSTPSFGCEVKREVPCSKILRHVKDLLKSHGDRYTKF